MKVVYINSSTLLLLRFWLLLLCSVSLYDSYSMDVFRTQLTDEMSCELDLFDDNSFEMVLSNNRPTKLQKWSSDDNIIEIVLARGKYHIEKNEYCLIDTLWGCELKYIRRDSVLIGKSYFAPVKMMDLHDSGHEQELIEHYTGLNNECTDLCSPIGMEFLIDRTDNSYVLKYNSPPWETIELRNNNVFVFNVCGVTILKGKWRRRGNRIRFINKDISFTACCILGNDSCIIRKLM